MPIPKPKKGEKEKDYISRCMGAIGGEYDDEKQAVAICYQTWKDKDKPKSNEMVPLTANIDLSDVKTVKYKGRSYYSAPVIMAVPGVMNGYLYPAEELSKFVQAWDGRPVTLFHPKDSEGNFISANSVEVPPEVHLGMLRNTRWDDEKLKSETWIDIEHTRTVRPEVLEYYEGGKDKLEVSTGLWGDVIRANGDHNGEKYTGIMTNIRPDHLATLPGGEGACSWNDGCGLRANEETGEEWEDWLASVTQHLVARYWILNITDRELRSKIQDALNKTTPRNTSAYLEEIDLTKKEVIYEQYTRSIGNGEVPVSVETAKFYRRGYTMENGEVKLTEPAVEVTRVISYKTVSNMKGDEETMAKKMSKEEKVQALIDDPRTRFEAGCKDFLNGFNEEQLDRLMPPDDVIMKPKEEPKPNLQQVVENETKKALDAKPQTTEEWLAAHEQMPKEIRDSILEGIALNAMQRSELIESITKDPRNTFTNEQLIGKSTSELKALAKFVAPLPNAEEEGKPFYGMRIPAGNKKAEDDKGPEPLNVPDLTETFKANLNKK